MLVNPDYGNDSGLDWKAVAGLPMVTQAGRENGIIALPLPVRGPNDLEDTLGLAQLGSTGRTLARLHVLHGRVPNPDAADEVLVNPRLARLHHLDVGDTFGAVILAGADLEAASTAGRTFADLRRAVNRGELGTHVRLRVAGIAETPEEIVVDEGFEQSEIVATPAFMRRYPQADAGYFGVAARLRRGQQTSRRSSGLSRGSRTRARSSSRPPRSRKRRSLARCGLRSAHSPSSRWSSP